MTTDHRPIDWTTDQESRTLDAVTLDAAPVARLIPDGLRVRVHAFHETDRRTGERLRVASVSVERDQVDQGVDRSSRRVRFAGTDTDGRAWSRVGETSKDSWSGGSIRVEHATAYRAGGYDDLPDGAARAFRAAMESAFRFVLESMPELWTGAAYVHAVRELESADQELEKARVTRRAAAADLQKTRRAAIRAGLVVDGTAAPTRVPTTD